MLRMLAGSGMRDYFQEMLGGAGGFRFFIQPAVAVTLGIIDGLREVRKGRPPYLLSLLRERGSRAEKGRELVRRLAVPLVLGVTLSVLFQLIIRGAIRWAAAVGFGVFFIVLPYATARAVFNRLAGWLANRRLRA